MSAEPLRTDGDAAPGELASPPRERVWLFAKEREGRLSGDFVLREFRCHCAEAHCHQTLIDPRLVDTLQTIRNLVARPVLLGSGYRCPTHNRRVGGRTRSYHTQGMAADIRCHSRQEFDEIEAAARRIPSVGAIGCYPAQGYLHLDLRRRAADGSLVEWSV